MFFCVLIISYRIQNLNLKTKQTVLILVFSTSVYFNQQNHRLFAHLTLIILQKQKIQQHFNTHFLFTENEVFNAQQKLEENTVSIYKHQMSFERENLWKYDSEFDNTLILNELSTTVLFQPLVQYQQVKPVQEQETTNFMSAFAGSKQFLNSLRLLSTEPLALEKCESVSEVIYFSSYQKNQRTGDKRYLLLPLYNLQKKGQTIKVNLEEPKALVIVNNRLLVAVEKKCVSLYSIQNGQFTVKDFDAIGVGNRLVLIDSQHIKYKGRDFIIFFGNEKDDAVPYFKCIVYEVVGYKLKFIKKATILKGEVYRPIILFDKYPGSDFQDQKFCLVLGGYEDYELQNYRFGGIQIHLHLLVQEWVEYSPRLTKSINFKQKHTITAGRALKVTTDMVNDECWLLFCTQYQTISKMYIRFGHSNVQQFEIQEIDLSTRRINVRDEKEGTVEPIHYSYHTIYLLKAPDVEHQPDRQIPYRVYWVDRNLEKIRSRPLREFLSVFAKKSVLS